LKVLPLLTLFFSIQAFGLFFDVVKLIGKAGKILEIPANSSDFFYFLNKIGSNSCMLKKNDYICRAEWQHSAPTLLK